MRVLVSGSHGLIGSALVPYLRTGGHEVVRLARSRQGDEPLVLWDPMAAELRPSDLDGFDAVVHLAGEGLMGRWTDAKKGTILDSRSKGTRLLADALARLERPPGVFVCASGINYYGDCGEEPVTEERPKGGGFLAGVVQVWEDAAQPARAAGIRTVHLRQSMVLSPRGGGLAAMLRPFRLGLGGRFGSGRQYMSWIAIDDLLDVYLHALTRLEVAGPVNASAPGPVPNAEFTRILARVLGRPAPFVVPAAVLRAAMGPSADEMLLASCRVLPARLEATGFRFRFKELEPALRHLLGRNSSNDRESRSGR